MWNNGHGIPVEMHAKEKMYVPELIFGTLLTSSNYNDEQRKVTGGRNGYGAKLCNIFSTEFTVETASSESGKSFKQVCTLFKFTTVVVAIKGQVPPGRLAYFPFEGCRETPHLMV